MVALLKQTEAIPETYPDVNYYRHRMEGYFTPLSEDAVLNNSLIWQRIESYIAHRWTEREVVWIIDAYEGDDWTPPLTPLGSYTAEKWELGAWVSTALPNGPLGFTMPSDGVFRITATIGGGDVPEAVKEAFRRLYEYSRGVAEQWRNDAAFRKSGENELVASWAGKALQLSGAADLLRPYRKA